MNITKLILQLALCFLVAYIIIDGYHSAWIAVAQDAALIVVVIIASIFANGKKK
jgi:hypothetical protein